MIKTIIMQIILIGFWGGIGAILFIYKQVHNLKDFGEVVDSITKQIKRSLDKNPIYSEEEYQALLASNLPSEDLINSYDMDESMADFLSLYLDVYLAYVLTYIVNFNSHRKDKHAKAERTFKVDDVFMDYSTSTIYIVLKSNTQTYAFSFMTTGDDILTSVHLGELLIENISEQRISEEDFIHYAETQDVYRVLQLMNKRLVSKGIHVYEGFTIESKSIKSQKKQYFKTFFKPENVETVTKIKSQALELYDEYTKAKDYYNLTVTTYTENDSKDIDSHKIKILENWLNYVDHVFTKMYPNNNYILDYKNILCVDSVSRYCSVEDELIYIPPYHWIIEKALLLRLNNPKDLIADFEIGNPYEITNVFNVIEMASIYNQSNLVYKGIMLANKVFVARRDYEEAFRCFIKGASSEPMILPFVAYCYENGIGTHKDILKAGNCYYMFIEIADAMNKGKQITEGYMKTLYDFSASTLDKLYLDGKWEKRDSDVEKTYAEIRNGEIPNKVNFTPKRIEEVNEFFNKYRKYLSTGDILTAGQQIRSLVEAATNDIVEAYSPENIHDKQIEKLKRIESKAILNEHYMQIFYNLTKIGNKAVHDGGAELKEDDVRMAEKVIPELIEGYMSLAS